MQQWQSTVTLVVNSYARKYSADYKQDLKQECWMALLQERQRVEEVQNRSTAEAQRLVYAICRNRVVNVLKHKRVQQKHEVPLTAGILQGAELAQPLSSQFDVEDVKDAISNLAGIEYYVINALFYEAKTYAEVAVALGKTTRGVQKIRSAALLKLRNLLE